VLPSVDHRLVEVPGRDTVGGPLQSADPTSEHAGGREPGDQGDREDDEPGQQEAALDDVDRGVRVLDRLRDDEVPSRGRRLKCDLAVALVSMADVRRQRSSTRCGVANCDRVRARVPRPRRGGDYDRSLAVAVQDNPYAKESSLGGHETLPFAKCTFRGA